MGEGSGNGQVVARGEQREVFGLLLVVRECYCPELQALFCLSVTV
jgi:hypothetical protein